MARDWRKVALAVLTAAALASVCVARLARRSPADRQGRQGARKIVRTPSERQDDDEEEQAKAPAKKKRQDPVEAQRAIEDADKLLQGGKAEQAHQTLTVTLAGGNLPPAIMAKALYIRGMAYRQQSKPAQAISDLTSALWLKGGLTEEDRADCAEAARRRLRRCRSHRKRRDCRRRRASDEGSQRTASAKSWGVVTTPTDNSASNTTQTAEGGGNWFKNWFNSAAPSAQANSAPPVTASIDKTEAPPQGCAGACGPARRQCLVEQDAGQCRNGAAPRFARPALPPAAGRGQIPGPACYRAHPAGSGRAGRQSQTRPRRRARPRTGNRPGGIGQYGLFLPGAGRALCDRAGNAGRVRQGQRHRLRLHDGDAVAHLCGPPVTAGLSRRTAILPFLDRLPRPFAMVTAVGFAAGLERATMRRIELSGTQGVAAIRIDERGNARQTKARLRGGTRWRSRAWDRRARKPA